MLENLTYTQLLHLCILSIILNITLVIIAYDFYKGDDS